MFIIDLSTPAFCDVELCVDLIQTGGVLCFRNPLKHRLQLLLYVRFKFRPKVWMRVF